MDIPKHFSFEGKALRTFADENGEPWFCAADVCEVLGYANSRQAVQKNCRDKGVSSRDTLTDGGTQALTFISEGNLYRLVIKSRKPEAERFETWVMEEVLPSIRKKGGYIAPSATQKQIHDLVRANEALAVSLDKQRQENEALDLEVRQKCVENLELCLALEEVPVAPLFDDCGGYPNESIYSDKFMSAFKQVKTEKAQKYFMSLGRTLDNVHRELNKLKHKYNELNTKYQKLVKG